MSNYTLKELSSNIEFEIEDYKGLLELFVDTTDSNLSDIRSASASSDNDIVSSNIHNIKGASMNLGLDRIIEIVGKMSKLNEDGSFTDIEAIVTECELELNKLRSLLE